MSSANLNMDPDEIHKFTEMAHDWWNPEGLCKPLHQLNPFRLKFILDKLDKPELDQKNIIDIGCGGGILTESLAQGGGTVTGLDLSEPALEAARIHAKLNKLNINYVYASAENYADEHAGKFDIVTCMEMLEHVPDPQAILKACSKLLTPNGKLFLSTINRNIKSYLFAVIGAEWMLNLLPKGTHDYAKFITPSELSQWAREANISIKDFQGLIYNIFSKEFTLDKTDITVNYLAYGEKNT